MKNHISVLNMMFVIFKFISHSGMALEDALAAKIVLQNMQKQD